MRTLTPTLSALAALMTALTLTGCTSTTDKQPGAATTQAATSPAQASALPPVTAAALLSAPVPPSCNHPAGTLVNGSLPLPQGSGAMQLGWLDTPSSEHNRLVLGDLNGDGRQDAAAVLDCTAGMGAWPQIIAFYAPGPKLLGSVNLATINLPGHAPGLSATVNSMSLRDGGIDVTWATQQEDDDNATETLAYSATLRWNGQRIVSSNVTATTEIGTVSKFLADLGSGNTTAAAALAAPGVGAEAANTFRSYPTALKSSPVCHGLLAPNLPQRVRALVDSLGSAEHPNINRVCLLPAAVDSTKHIVLGMKSTGSRHWQVAWIRVL